MIMISTMKLTIVIVITVVAATITNTAAAVFETPKNYAIEVEKEEGGGGAAPSESPVQQQQQQQQQHKVTLMDEDEDLPPLFPFRLQDYVGFGVAVFGLLLAAGGGIGGGGILVPTYILLLDFPVKHAIPLASTTVFGGAVANNMLNARKVHPNHPNRKVIDWELITQLEPMTILGALVGAILNDFLPDLVLIVMMVLLLTVTAYKTLVKAHKLNQNEMQDRIRMRNGINNGGGKVMDETTPLVASSNDDNSKDKTVITALSPAATVDMERQATTTTEEEEEEQDEEKNSLSSLWPAIRLTALFVVVTVLNLFKGGPGEAGGGPMGLEYCNGTCFWVVEVTIIVVIVIFAIHSRHDLLSRIKRGEPIPSDIVWTDENTIVYPCYAIVAGLVAGLFGVGGVRSSMPTLLYLRSSLVRQHVSPLFNLSVILGNHQRTVDACTFSSSSCRIGDISLYDSLHQFYSDCKLHDL